MTDRDREKETGQFTTEYTDDEFIDAIEQSDGGATTSEVADIVGCDRRTAYIRLSNLEKKSVIHSREVGNSLLWENK
jgi:GTP-sensing pleiotropic transcriptional regulator CodY